MLRLYVPPRGGGGNSQHSFLMNHTIGWNLPDIHKMKFVQMVDIINWGKF